MIAYLDTHALIHLALGRSRLIGREASRLIQRAELLISPMVLVELEYLYEIATVAGAAIDEIWTRDVFDRIIVANARVNGLAPLISADERIAEHYPRAVW